MFVRRACLCLGLLVPAGCLSSRPRTSKPIAPIRVLSFNIRYGTAPDGPNAWPRRRAFVIEFLQREQPDLIGWQETLRGQLDDLRAALPDCAELGVGRDDGKTAGEYSAIFYRKERFAARRSGTFWFCDTPDKPGTPTWGRRDMRRICTWANLLDRASDRSFWLFNVHLDDQSQVSREKSVALLLNRIAARGDDRPVLVTGDFNAGEDNPAILRMKQAGWIDAHRLRFPHQSEADLSTFHGFRGVTTGKKIDYVLVQSKADVLDAHLYHDRRGDVFLSDHYPISSTIRLR